MTSDLTSLAGVVGDSVDRWANRGHLILPGPVDLAPSLAKAIAHDALAAGWRPPAQVIETPEEAESLPARTVVMDSPYPEGDVYQRTSDGHWVEPGFHGTFTTRILSFPVTVLYLPADITERPSA